MRIILSVLNLLVGLLAIACIAGFVGWAWPGASQITWGIATIAMVVLVVTGLVRLVRGKPKGI